MRSTRTRSINQANVPNRMLCALAFSTCLALTPSPASAMMVAPSGWQQQQLKQDNLVTEVCARAYAGSPPVPGYCWYYSDPGKTQGSWDVCP